MEESTFLLLDFRVILAFGVDSSSHQVQVLKYLFGFILFHTVEIWFEIYINKKNSPNFLNINT